MSIFNLHSSVLADCRDFVRSFFTVADDRAREFIGRELVEQARLWPEALLQVSPSYARVASTKCGGGRTATICPADVTLTTSSHPEANISSATSTANGAPTAQPSTPSRAPPALNS